MHAGRLQFDPLDVPARYQVTIAETVDGKLYLGLVIDDAVDSLLLQTGPSATVRLDGHAVVSQRVAPISLLPAGLLHPLSDQETVDLYAYHRMLGGAQRFYKPGALATGSVARVGPVADAPGS
jgi:hypothetical protein